MLTNAVNKLRRAFGDDRANPQVIETIPKAGYRLKAPVQPLAPVPVRDIPENRTGEVGEPAKLRWLVPAVLVLVAGLVVLFVTRLQLTGPEPASSGPAVQQASRTRPVLAVLPFENLSAEPAEE